MGRTVANAIREQTDQLLNQENGLLFGQCITGVGWVGNTVPEQTAHIVELPMNDNSGPGIAIGAAMMGRPSIYVIRYQAYLWLAASQIVNYAAKAKEVFGYSIPLMVRAIGDEGRGLGPVSSGTFHSVFMHMPGLTVAAPMTPKEVDDVWSNYRKDATPYLVSEHRKGYATTDTDMTDISQDDADVAFYGISAPRLHLKQVSQELGKQNIKSNIKHVYWLKRPGGLQLDIAPLKKAKVGIVVDSGFEICGAAQSLAYELMIKTGKPVYAMALKDRSSGVAAHLENLSPSAAEIKEFALKSLKSSWNT
jgi:acetoin:2,6-dichlorophenolindophenol oxidoreductase subunit beta